MRKSLVLAAILCAVCSPACGGAASEAITGEQSSALGGDPRTPAPTANPVPCCSDRIEPSTPRGPAVPAPPAASLYGTITGYAGFPESFGHNDLTPQTSFARPTLIASTPTGLTWVIDMDETGPFESRIRLIRNTRGAVPGPHVETIRQPDANDYYVPGMAGIQGVAVDPANDDLVLAMPSRLLKLSVGGQISIFVGSFAGFNDGSTDPRFRRAAGLAYDAQGNLFVADTTNHAIRKVTPAGYVSTVAHDTSALPFSPESLAIDRRDGSLYATSGHAVYRVVPGATAATGTVAIYAGSPTTGGYRDDIAGSALFYEPKGLAVDRSGNVYVADKGTAHVRKIIPSSIPSPPPAKFPMSMLARVETVSVQPFSSGITFDGYGPDDAVIDSPWGLSFWGDALVMSDAVRGTIRVLH